MTATTHERPTLPPVVASGTSPLKRAARVLGKGIEEAGGWVQDAAQGEVTLPGGWVLIRRSLCDAREDNAFLLGVDTPQRHREALTVPRRRSA